MGGRVDRGGRLAPCSASARSDRQRSVRLRPRHFGQRLRAPEVLLLLPLAGFASGGGSGLTAQETLRPEIRELSERHAWRGLLHFDRGGTLRARRSAVTSRTFFFAEGGEQDPARELAATLEALSRSPDETDQGDHAQCRFPARALWLEREGRSDDLPLVHVAKLSRCHPHNRFRQGN